MASSIVPIEGRPSKRPRICPDVYPQELKQREDDLSADHLKKGLDYSVIIKDSLEKVFSFFISRFATFLTFYIFLKSYRTTRNLRLLAIRDKPFVAIMLMMFKTFWLSSRAAKTKWSRPQWPVAQLQ